MMNDEAYLTPITQPARVLIVDDNPKNLQVLGRLLQEANYAIEFATNGKAALEWIEIQGFDIMLLDINMPEMDGFEVCRKIRINPKLDKMPIIFLSANSDRESILKGFEQGAQDYVSKPFDSRELLVRVKTHLSLKESREKLEKMNRELEDKVKERTLHLQIANNQLQTLNKDLVLAKERAEASDRLKSAFLNNISHEIRTPLNGILGFAPFIIEPGITQEEKETYLKILNESSKRLVDTITDYVDISLLSSGTMSCQRDAVSLCSVFKQVQTIYGKICTEKGLIFNVHFANPEDSPIIHTDEKLLTKALSHLLNNAIKFTFTGEIELGYQVLGDKIKILVSDTGVGISEDALKRIFEVFMQENTANTRGHEGSGLGLSITSGILKLLGGEINIDSDKGKGTVVKLILPIG